MLEAHELKKTHIQLGTSENPSKGGPLLKKKDQRGDSHLQSQTPAHLELRHGLALPSM